MVERTRLHRTVQLPVAPCRGHLVGAVDDVAEAEEHQRNILIHELGFVRLEQYSRVIAGLSQAVVDVAMAIDGLIRP